ncbi:MAG: hypothetical protein PHO75_02395 [Candidatus Shapirobacteria bacterium]|nr:hypothetical protein [Candidatus Shapirobacteria bacterium]
MSGGFSPETRQHQKELQNHRCALLHLEVDILEGHHCIPKIRGGSNNPHNCIELAGEGAYCAYGFPVSDIHEMCDRKALDEGLFLNPDTLEFVPREQMPNDCFRNGNCNLPEKRNNKHMKKSKCKGGKKK